MIEFEQTEVFNIDGALRGIRNSWESHDKSDSYYDSNGFNLGEADKKLALNLIKAGSSHAKFMRQILVSVDIIAPLYWFKEFDQYKVGTVTNSESTMHRIMSKPFTVDLFSFEDPHRVPSYHLTILDMLENLRKEYLKTKDQRVWKYLIQLLPSGWMQKRTTTLNYAVIANAYHDRRNHRLTEWHDFCSWAESLPYSELITGIKEEVK